MVVTCVGLDIVKKPHHLLAEPDIFVRVNRLDAPFSAGRHKGQVFSRRGTCQRGLGVLFRSPARFGMVLAHRKKKLEGGSMEYEAGGLESAATTGGVGLGNPIDQILVVGDRLEFRRHGGESQK